MYVALYSEREEVRLQQRRVRDVPSGSVPFLRRPCKRAAKPRTGRTSSGPLWPFLSNRHTTWRKPLLRPSCLGWGGFR